MKLRLIRLLVATVLLTLVGASASATEAKHVPWGFEEYEFFAQTKQQLATRFKGLVYFRDDMTRVVLAPQPGNCAGYDGPTFLLTFANGKVARVQRVFVGCKETQYGTTLDSKEAALKYAIAGLSQYTNLTPKEKARLQAARAELAALQKSSAPQNSSAPQKSNTLQKSSASSAR